VDHRRAHPQDRLLPDRGGFAGIYESSDAAHGFEKRFAPSLPRTATTTDRIGSLMGAAGFRPAKSGFQLRIACGATLQLGVF
jgi:hypothetical protein